MQELKDQREDFRISCEEHRFIPGISGAILASNDKAMKERFKLCFQAGQTGAVQRSKKKKKTLGKPSDCQPCK